MNDRIQYPLKTVDRQLVDYHLVSDIWSFGWKHRPSVNKNHITYDLTLLTIDKYIIIIIIIIIYYHHYYYHLIGSAASSTVLTVSSRVVL